MATVGSSPSFTHPRVLAGRYVVPLLLHVGPLPWARSAPVGLSTGRSATPSYLLEVRSFVSVLTRAGLPGLTSTYSGG